MSDEFETWWASFPEKVGKLAARKEYEKARKMATAQELLDGVTRYRQHKPGWKAWCNPRTWLHQGRWLDVYDTTPAPILGRPSDAEQDDYHAMRQRAIERQKAVAQKATA